MDATATAARDAGFEAALEERPPVEVPVTGCDAPALVDAADADWVLLHRWCRYKPRRSSKTVYAQTSTKTAGKWVRMSMHRLIVGAKPGEVVDHRDGNGLNNCRSNLRVATRNQNQHNSGSRGGKSRFKGVSWHRTAKKWHARIWLNGRCHSIGYFDAEEAAAAAYDRKAGELHGEYARLNFPERPRVGEADE